MMPWPRISLACARNSATSASRFLARTGVLLLGFSTASGMIAK
jgi:hypothetical protein